MTNEELKELLKRIDELEKKSTLIWKTMLTPLQDEIRELRAKAYNQSVENTETLERDEIWEVFLLPNDEDPNYLELCGDIEKTSLDDIRMTNNDFRTLESALGFEGWKKVRDIAKENEDTYSYCKFHWDANGKAHFIGEVNENDPL